jgi:hypothetical protein
MDGERTCLKCERLGSVTSLCPKRNKQILSKARNLVSELSGLVLNEKDFENLKEIALNCEYFEGKTGKTATFNLTWPLE